MLRGFSLLSALLPSATISSAGWAIVRIAITIARLTIVSVPGRAITRCTSIPVAIPVTISISWSGHYYSRNWWRYPNLGARVSTPVSISSAATVTIGICVIRHNNTHNGKYCPDNSCFNSHDSLVFGVQVIDLNLMPGFKEAIPEATKIMLRNSLRRNGIISRWRRRRWYDYHLFCFPIPGFQAILLRDADICRFPGIEICRLQISRLRTMV